MAIKYSIKSLQLDEISIEKINNHIAHDLNLLSEKGFKKYDI